MGGHVGAVKMLLDYGASIDAIDNVKSFLRCIQSKSLLLGRTSSLKVRLEF
jgi:hypothetical protein